MVTTEERVSYVEGTQAEQSKRLDDNYSALREDIQDLRRMFYWGFGVLSGLMLAVLIGVVSVLFRLAE